MSCGWFRTCFSCLFYGVNVLPASIDPAMNSWLEDYWPLLPLFCHFYGRGERFDLLEDKVTITPDPSVPTPLAPLPLRLRLRPFGFTTLAAWRSSHRRIHHAFFGYVFPHASTNFKHWNPKIARRSPPCRPIFGVPCCFQMFSGGYPVLRVLP